MIDKIGRFYLPTKSPDKNLSADKIAQFCWPSRACSVFDDFVGQLFVYRSTNFFLYFHSDCLHWKI